MGTERVVVQRPAFEPLISAIKQHLSTFTVGDPEHATLPSLFTERSADGIIAMLKEAKEAGAEVLLGDMEKAGPALLKPHILLGVKPETRLWQRESFGPVLVVAVVDTIDEAVELANASNYSLTAALWTKDVYNAMNVSMRIHSGGCFHLPYLLVCLAQYIFYTTGSVNINGPTIHIEGLIGLSGLG
jgi:acyl-CoA reductase-like NAD-dependent aldehyde dehydrogenase